MLEKIPVLDSTVIRALVVALLGVVGMICSFFGVSDALFANEKVERLADGMATLVTLFGVVWAGWARATKPSPPLTETAKQATVEAVQSGKLENIAMPPRQGGFLRLAFALFLALFLAVAAGGFLAGCSGTKAAYAVAASRPATVLPDTAYVLAEQYRAVLHEAADLKASGRLPAHFVERMQSADDALKPLVLGDPAAVPPRKGLQQLSETFQAVRSAATEAELQRAVDDAVLALAEFLRTVQAARSFQ